MPMSHLDAGKSPEDRIQQLEMSKMDETEIEGTALDDVDRGRRDDDGNPLRQSERRYETEAGGQKYSIVRGGHAKELPENERAFHESYETINLPDTLSVDVPEAGHLDLSRVRVAHVNVTKKGESRWGDGAFTNLPVERPSFEEFEQNDKKTATATIDGKPTTSDVREGDWWVFSVSPERTVRWNPTTDHAWEHKKLSGRAAELIVPVTQPPEFNTEDKSFAVGPVESRKFQRVQYNFDFMNFSLDDRAGNALGAGRVKFEVEVAPETNEAA